jgi:hypothetical protein
MTEPELTPLGAALEAARGGTSKRAAARSAGISEGRWRQIVVGYQLSGGVRIPANPRRETVIAMADAVHLDRATALELAGFDPASVREDSPVVQEVEQAIRAIPGLSKRQQAAMIAVYRALREDGPNGDPNGGEEHQAPQRKRRAGER